MTSDRLVRFVTVSVASEEEPVTSRGGRPRDPRIEKAVLKATAQLLVKRGYAELSLDEVAARAKTTKPAIYRRWKSKARLVHEAAFPVEIVDVGLHSDEPGHTLADDIREMVVAAVHVMASPVARAAIPGLIGEFQNDPSLHTSLLERFQTGPMVWAAERLHRAIDEGEARAGVELPTVVSLIAGAIFFRLLVETGQPCDEAWIDRTTNLVLRGVLP